MALARTITNKIAGFQFSPVCLLNSRTGDAKSCPLALARLAPIPTAMRHDIQHSVDKFALAGLGNPSNSRHSISPLHIELYDR
jgi:hypothetical protein